MAELNTLMSDVKKLGAKIEDSLKELFSKYEALYREAYSIYSTERVASKSTEGLEDFYRMISLIRRNRNVIGSLTRGMRGVRSLDGYSIVEEEVPQTTKKKEKKKEPQLNERELESIHMDATEQPTIEEPTEGPNG